MLTRSRQSGIGVFCVEACFKYDVVLVALLYCYAVLCKLDATALVDSACRHVTDTTICRPQRYNIVHACSAIPETLSTFTYTHAVIELTSIPNILTLYTTHCTHTDSRDGGRRRL
jgi:hypothetical protein